MMDLLLKNANIVTENGVVQGNLAVRSGRIAAVLPLAEIPQARAVIDVHGQYLLPGGIDCHVHFNDPGYTWREDFIHGSRAAAAGGITTVVDMPMQNKPAVTDAAVLQRKLDVLKGRSYVDYALWGALIRTNEADLDGLNDAGAVAFKCFMCDPGKDYTELNLSEIESRLNQLKAFNGLAGFHCEDYKMIKDGEAVRVAAGQTGRGNYLAARPPEAELKAASEIINLAHKTGARVHICHVSHPKVAALIRRAKADGVKVSGETCMHYLLFSEQDLLSGGARFKCSPPLRSIADSQELWEYVADGTLDCICSDHSPSALEEKSESSEKGAFGAWGGISGVQTSLQIFWDYAVNKKQVSPVIVARALAANPARIFGIYGRKGALREGFDADFTVLDGSAVWKIKEENLEYLNKFSAFCGLSGRGQVKMTFLRGNLIYKQGSFSAVPGGQFISRLSKG